MRNLLHRLSLLVAAALLATALLGSFSADPAGASTFSSRVHRPYRSRPYRGRAYRLRASRSAYRAAVFTSGDVWARLRHCESGGRYTANTGNGFYGAYQFVPRTWRTLGFSGLPHEAPPEVQDEAARRLQARSGWGQWPVCSRRIGAR
jgi:Transglycosylase-like domain